MRIRIRHSAYGIVAVLILVASCRFDLPRISGADAPGDLLGTDGPFQFSSCMGLAATCGASANENCCQTMTIPAGSFYRRYDGVVYNDMSFPATLSEFKLDKYEVSVGRFRAFVNAGLGTSANPPAAEAGAHPHLAGSGWDSSWNSGLVTDTVKLIAAVKCDSTYKTWTDIPGANENKPMNCVTWYEAMAFCIWDGGYLPTGAERNYAASGGIEQRVYPWSTPAGSTAIDCTYANYKINSPAGAYCVNGTTGGTNRVGSESPKGDGKWGHSDLAGNVEEFVLEYDGNYPVPCNDCANLTPSSNRVQWGGNFTYLASSLSVVASSGSPPDTRYYAFGVRCARTP